MPQQIDDQQYYAIKACLERAYDEIKNAFTILYGNSTVASPPAIGAAPTKANSGGKQFSVPPPKVTKDHQAAVNAIDPDVQAQRQAEEQVSQGNLKRSIADEVLVVSASASGTGDYYALVQCNNTMQRASIKIDEDEYNELSNVTADDEVYYSLDQTQIETAEWEPLRGTSTDPQAGCNCGGNVANANPYNDEKIEAEIVAGHTRKCSFWDYNTITYDQKNGNACQVDLDQYDKSAQSGFDVYNDNRREILKRIADPADPLRKGAKDELDSMVESINNTMAGITGDPNFTVTFDDGDEDEE